MIENIYAGPQGSFVPKTFSTQLGMQTLAELGFVVVQIDGMGTANRSKAFHDVAFKNLADAGFADRILWHKAVAAKYPWYDVSRVGIYGTSAGGQNAMAAVLFHPEFYKAAAAASGCHDNRMDKIWWNEQWMSWPLGPHYAASSNMENAAKLQGRLLLIYGEMDTNVDPSSTMQVVEPADPGEQGLRAGRDTRTPAIPAAARTAITSGSTSSCGRCAASNRRRGRRSRRRAAGRAARIGRAERAGRRCDAVGGGRGRVPGRRYAIAFFRNCRSPSHRKSALNAISPPKTTYPDRCGNCGTSALRNPSLA